MKIAHAIILSAGQGSRLSPLTEDRPKCLIEFKGRSLIGWQIEALRMKGVTDIAVVTGFRSDLVEAELAQVKDVRARVVFNPFYHVADNLGSLWIAREEMRDDFIILNGDTLISPDIVARLIAAEQFPITVTVDIKDSYDADDMKVEREGDRLIHIGKTLTPEQSNAESIGMLAFRREGGARFRREVEEMMRTPAGVSNWYLRAIDRIAPEGVVGTVSIQGLGWGEVDYPSDLVTAEQLADKWVREGFGG
jgi:L-glutamine-phosphate cytidylyltransferase